MMIERAKSGTLEATDQKTVIESLFSMIFAAGEKELSVLTMQVNDINKARGSNERGRVGTGSVRGMVDVS